MSISVFNRRWAAVLLETLTRHGVQHVCIAPGSRSTSLTLEAAANAKITCHTHFDERGLGHLALGIAKVTGQPVAVIVTSGTAVANLYPALIEASLTGERLVLLTADRPPELIDCGANQAIRQQGIFADHPGKSLSLPRPTPDISAAWLASTLDQALSEQKQGALHINCPFAEPLYGGDASAYADWSETLGDWWQGDKPWLINDNKRMVTQQSDWPQWRQRRGVVVAARMGAEQGKQVAAWAKTLGWPLLADVLSSSGQPLPCADLWLNNPKAQEILAQAEMVVQFGASLTGKRMLQWQASCCPKEYWLIDHINGRLDPANHCGRRLVADISEWLKLHPAEARQPWADQLTLLATRARTHVTESLAHQFGEAQLACHLSELLPANGVFWAGNSLIVRLIDALAQLPAGYPVYSNRGASGIDGLFSTAAGVQRAANKPMLAVLGDISALYDLNSLALMKQCTAPVVLVVVNNDGGSIFSLLPTPEAERERFYRMPHGINFEHAAAMFGLTYANPKSWQAVKQTVDAHWQQGGVLLLELQVAPHDGAETLRQLVNDVVSF
ncbi:2-succinyl-5-enolpyruvyl-6-hydroxy-3-cyclohexene-1-carboxylic-acid synthase [Budviciaceae bacterium BWR-B9]|uniref:2-succinyl-5-enolpyruvyl-6-hydroxy-3-cyclohexene-1-carboxylate synthase n=1 Tax=Limnobaculum allomyrinae TaxID=2791986 RepID=A0ABS1IU86_9GAMM|nr:MULTISPECIES: 2-succinyl-5-enolpyruvyl-6-hydroxy-3-cyclohexene-1-carboxylic-acid synthase [Limnobaculum]MBK5145311.1 2-succinyl-5-enolpyruvyl-6-hydroxy-3-cyclohexene-1-carboxylic-acid synthase [Limnobaculum allomyrinae]MBV7693261.1 2-succinyl-5-enolpyruvyl-6-hydroxy-3-cyclohexene-1-carboxylic-acid synthase [Limnobaculum sp. M2-1]